MSSRPRPVLAPGRPREHGGPDAAGVPAHDFSTNSNACGPCPKAWHAVLAADVTRYPDAHYQHLRVRLAQHHAVDPARVALAGSASEFIFRFTAWAARQGAAAVEVPRHAYGDYAQAAQAWGLPLHPHADGKPPTDLRPPAGPGAAAAPPSHALSPPERAVGAWGALAVEGPVAPASPRLRWACDPGSPLGQGVAAAVFDGATWGVLDRAYHPLRLSGHGALSDAALDRVWQLFSPNKSLGLTGVRGAYAIAPVGAEDAVHALADLCPSWPLGAQGVAMLQAWCAPETAAWLCQARATLADWKAQQQALFTGLGWAVLPSQANYFCVAVPAAWQQALPAWRRQGLKLRDARSFGLPGHWRLGVLSPASQAALQAALHQGPPPALPSEWTP